jgi:hypothetical protein
VRAKLLPWLLSLLLLAWSGCGSPADLAPAVRYDPPNAQTGTSAFIKGTDKWVLVGYRPTVYAHAINGRMVVGGSQAFKDLLPVPTGMVDVEVGFAFGAINRRTTLSFRAAAGELYEIQFLGDGPEGMPRKWCEVWIGSLTTGLPVSPVERLTVTP